MWEPFIFYSSRLIQSSDPASNLYALQVRGLWLRLQYRLWILHVLQTVMDCFTLEIRKEVLLSAISCMR